MKADRQSTLKLLKTVNGQVGGLIKMVEEDRYCIDISTQILSAVSILKKVNTQILTAHLKNCVMDLGASDNEGRQTKIQEVADIIKKLNK